MEDDGVAIWRDFTECGSFKRVEKHLIAKHGKQLAYDILDEFIYRLQAVRSLAQQPPEFINSIKKSNSYWEKRTDKINEARKHLEDAAALLGLRTTFFYSWAREENDGMDDVSKQAGKSKLYIFRKGNDVSTIPPRLEGETVEEYKARQRINHLLNSPILSDPHLNYANKSGGSSNKAMAVRLIWEFIPEGINYPYSAVEELMEFCGFNVSHGYVRSTILKGKT